MSIGHTPIGFFEAHFKRTPTTIVQAPGRVNLIGEHTDYNQGFVFPTAINFATTVAAAPREDRLINVVAVDYGNAVSQFSLDDIAFDHQQGWSNYVRGIVSVLQTRYEFGGADLLVTGNVPQGAGLSSSASLEIALLKAFADLYQLELDGVQAALLGQKAENDFVGCSCGIMDQLISAMGQHGHAMLLDCQSLAFQSTPIPVGYQLVIVNSNVQRALVDGEYNLRRQQCEEAAQIMGVESLRQASLPLLHEYRESLSETVFRRARHVMTENQRTLDMYSALSASDYRRIRGLMEQSHASMRDDFEITVPAIDYLVEVMQSVLGDAGGARMTGGGFGGCVVALAPEHLVPEMLSVVAERYYVKTGIQETAYVCTAEQGAFAPDR